MDKFNVMGSFDLVHSLSLQGRNKVVDRFPAPQGQADFNFEVEEEFVDQFVQFCEDNNLECEMVG